MPAQRFARDDRPPELFFDAAPRAFEPDVFPRDALPALVERFAVDRPPAAGEALRDDLLFDDDAERPPDVLFALPRPLADFEPFAAGFDDELFRDGDDELFALEDERALVVRGLDDEDGFDRAGVVTVSAAAPSAPTAAPVAAPLSISPATSNTLSITRDAVVLAELDLFLPDTEEFFFLPEVDEPDLLAITFPSQIFVNMLPVTSKLAHGPNI
jgi:hypothetical protein